MKSESRNKAKLFWNVRKQYFLGRGDKSGIELKSLRSIASSNCPINIIPKIHFIELVKKVNYKKKHLDLSCISVLLKIFILC